ncbi:MULTISPECIES: S26 family signal peptidase [unclassified Variovorax]|uniref:S26 family signal peptidase n=1 Tax=unclassified Variovorax TaxID=663243 RepID=UPI00076D19B7|nr:MULTISPECIES: S26 family signal peptidase [unclassified Variovorax]KWT98320.1 hypothetical protein APY03_0455 [Variovorax sp. WDL1]PNG50025.1 hypothetical protein CHC06_05606 [Variovorax sp. B2]PNG50897.1 hypothetical protein CHC07_05511 [Variovorax sp. B4]VTU41513.1 conjugal transfer peptidase TraF [Variovorax sp. SRS16]VTU41539.1 conjugal transfer peptidase TraF [Variovorax sp. PBL-E5]
MISRDAFERFFIILACSVLAIHVYVKVVPYSLSWNVTASIPRGLYLSTEATTTPLVRGQIGCFAYSAPTWAEARHYFPDGFQLCKYALGLPGDVVEVDASLRVSSAAGKHADVAFASADSRGRPMPRAEGLAGAIPRGEYLLLAPAHTNSLDSRYLGRIAHERLTRTLVPLLTW